MKYLPAEFVTLDNLTAYQCFFLKAIFPTPWKKT